ncbi:MAG: hypothetical protein J6V44_00080 [Methanobrevibacter sp.]|nr:hypothetical protein [Methanobrevibacter sp.]
MTDKVTTVRVVDTRIEPQPNPVYADTVGPVQNQYYKQPASGLSDSFITFNNLTTLGTDRAYLDTFELEITAAITFHQTGATTTGPKRTMWTLDSFPFNKCCEEVRVNINGGAFFSQPLSYLRAKERYWDEKAISDAYTGICPCHKPWQQDESGLNERVQVVSGPESGVDLKINVRQALEVGSTNSPSRAVSKGQYMETACGINSSRNSMFIPLYTEQAVDQTITVKWREPIFASPFSSRIDANYGRPLYNITSIDIAFNLQDLRNMILCFDPWVTDYEVHITDCQLRYQVETVPTGIAPSYTVVPYRRFVPYITDATQEIPAGESNAVTHISITSGTYTLNEIPTAIWVFAGPTKAQMQSHISNRILFENAIKTATSWCNNLYSYNRPFGFLDKVNISLGNTTQILNTAETPDLFRIAKANGCQDSYASWAIPHAQPGRFFPDDQTGIHSSDTTNWPSYIYRPTCVEKAYSAGMGSVLRLIPGTDIILPDQQLVPGSNANNMVFQITADFWFSNVPPNFRNVSLWLLFEYVGVATITPGQCEITMNPLSNGAAMQTAPVVSGTETEPVSTVEGSGWLDKLKEIAGHANNFAKKTGIVGNLLSLIPGVGPMLSTAAKTMGYGNPRGYGVSGTKRPRKEISGGAAMGLGDFI